MKFLSILFLIFFIGCANLHLNPNQKLPNLVCHNEFDANGNIKQVCEPQF